MKHYQPSQTILKKYADVLVNFALGGGKGVRYGETVIVQAGEYTKPLYVEVVKAIWNAGGHVIPRYSPDPDDVHNLDRDFYEIADEHQLEFFPEKYMRGMVEQADHSVFLIAETHPHALKGVHPHKIMRRNAAHKPYMDWRNQKENAGKFTWTLALYGTPAMAKEAGMSLEKYWKEIVKACFLDKPNPISEWRRVYRDLEDTRLKLNGMPIEKLHVEGPDADLWIRLGEKRRWMGGSGRNIPSFELFTSPDWRGTDGWIRFNQPLYRYGNLIEGVELEFKDGYVVKAKAKKNGKVLQSMIATPNADKIGEFSLTDKRFSRITSFMANTLFDENIGGKEGNTHIALGASYHDCYNGDPAGVTKEEWDRLGFNDSAVHTDIISTAPRTVTAYLRGGTHVIIYQNGQFEL